MTRRAALVPSPKRSCRQGFTLMETILAVALSATLLMMVAAGINIYSRLVSDRRSDVVHAQVAQAVLQLIAQDIRGTYYTEPKSDDAGSTDAADTETDAAGGETTGEADDSGASSTASSTSFATADLTTGTVQVTPGLYGNPYELQLDVFGRFVKPIRYDLMTMTGVDPRAANLWSDPKIVTYYVRPSDPNELEGTPLQSPNPGASGKSRNVLVRRVQSRARAIYASTVGDVAAVQDGEQLLSDQVASLEFAYFDGYEWLDEWDSSLNSGLPLAVQITIVVVDPETDVAGTSLIESTSDNTFQLTISLPNAEPPAAASSAL